MQRVLFVSSDAGGTSALVPVVQEMLARDAEVRIFASGPAVRVWEQANVAAEWLSIDDLVAGADAKAMIESFQPRVVVTGAGEYNLIEHTFRRAASALNVFCTAIMDYWAHYRRRFERQLNGRTESSVPDLIGVMDETCFAHMVDAGFDPDGLTIVGAPHLEVAARFVRESSRAEIDAWRAELELKQDSPTFVFFSQPVANEAEGPIPQIFSETTTMRQVVKSLAQACVSSGARPQLVVKAHPLESAAPLLTAAADTGSDDVDLHIIETYDARRLMCVADAVLGVTTTALLEAGLGGKPTYSIQLGKERSDSFYGTRAGITTPVYDTSKLGRIVRELLDSAPPSQSLSTRPDFRGSTARAVDMILGHGDTSDAPESPNAAGPP